MKPILVTCVAVALFIAGAEIFLVLGVSGLVGKHLFLENLPDIVMIQKMIGGINQSTLLAIPLFIFAAELMARGSIAARLTGMVEAFIGHRRGGLGHTTTGACFAFGAVSGSAPATVAGLGKILYPRLIETGTNRSFAVGLIVATAEISLLVPPSITLIIYGWLTGTSIIDLFAAGLAVGCLLAFCFSVYVHIRSLRDAPRLQEKADGAARRTAVEAALLPLGMPVIILGGIYSGAFTTTEAAAVAALYALLVETLITRALSWKGVAKVAESSALVTTTLFIILAVGSFASYLVTVAGVPAAIGAFIAGADISALQFLLIVNVVFLIAGMFMDPVSMQIVLVPVLAPVAMALGVDPVQFGIIVVLNVAIGTITPPFGLDLFVASSALRVPVTEIIAGVWPFLLVNLVVLALVTLFAPLSTFLPGLLH
ncbi:MAG: C4-dicarboxylate ABC transporter permease [Alcanivorax sp.]|nr:C4-dicarboxylate ABC transporter permease [Alcanivorax sp.]MBM1145665.1 TRAP transporter large permease [Alcanivorax sp. ZXX171]UWN50857.1 Ectoine TRAP transporter large permease protein TeaC [Alcanivorax sp. ALC70]MBI56006.1 C4-dicarboxylate ABC transporter permease [Alcanivorax sp.]MBU58493.1 C4-dicarboxylate ABC transporter permease [Alcanivorax sp.]|tara:strand:+ start:20506 stop:21786 length:1281 start_codon:yes stop_codon:yes gene_type:complete